eukprot:131948-Pleurochrysis_carterae.AAC.1
MTMPLVGGADLKRHGRRRSHRFTAGRTRPIWAISRKCVVTPEKAPFLTGAPSSGTVNIQRIV